MTREELQLYIDAANREVLRADQRFDAWMAWSLAARRAHFLALVSGAAWALSDCLHLGVLSLKTCLALILTTTVAVALRSMISMQLGRCTAHVEHVTRCLMETVKHALEAEHEVKQEQLEAFNKMQAEVLELLERHKR